MASLDQINKSFSPGCNTLVPALGLSINHKKNFQPEYFKPYRIFLHFLRAIDFISYVE